MVQNQMVPNSANQNQATGGGLQNQPVQLPQPQVPSQTSSASSQQKNKQKKKAVQQGGPAPAPQTTEQTVEKDKALVYDPKFKDVICYNCGEPGHYVGLCHEKSRCLICGKTGHHMDACLDWYKPMPMAQFLESEEQVK